MFTDNTLSFNTNWQTTQAITTTANSATVVDLTGAGSGNAPAMIGSFPAVNTAMGYDIGFGDGVAYPYLVINVVTAGGANSNTLTISLQSAPDNGSYSPGTWTTCLQSEAILDSTLTAGLTLIFPVPPRGVGAALPRFYRLIYTASATLTPLAVSAGILLNPPSQLMAGAYSANYVVV